MHLLKLLIAIAFTLVPLATSTTPTEISSQMQSITAQCRAIESNANDLGTGGILAPILDISRRSELNKRCTDIADAIGKLGEQVHGMDPLEAGEECDDVYEDFHDLCAAHEKALLALSFRSGLLSLVSDLLSLILGPLRSVDDNFSVFIGIFVEFVPSRRGDCEDDGRNLHERYRSCKDSYNGHSTARRALSFPRREIVA